MLIACDQGDEYMTRTWLNVDEALAWIGDRTESSIDAAAEFVKRRKVAAQVIVDTFGRWKNLRDAIEAGDVFADGIPIELRNHPNGGAIKTALPRARVAAIGDYELTHRLPGYEGQPVLVPKRWESWSDTDYWSNIRVRAADLFSAFPAKVDAC